MKVSGQSKYRRRSFLVVYFRFDELDDDECSNIPLVLQMTFINTNNVSWEWPILPFERTLFIRISSIRDFRQMRIKLTDIVEYPCHLSLTFGNSGCRFHSCPRDCCILNAIVQAWGVFEFLGWDDVNGNY